jgi:hypothetical protein
LRCSIEVDPNWVDTTNSAAVVSRSRAAGLGTEVGAGACAGDGWAAEAVSVAVCWWG